MRALIELFELIGQGKIPCLFHIITGAYCPGCGVTRAIKALLNADVIGSLRLHPLVVYGVTAVAVLFAYRLYCAVRKRRMAPSVFKISLYGALAVTVLNFLVKNYVLLVLHIDLLATG